jgi:DNA modification methylase
MVYPDDFIDQIICGDCLEVMKEIPDKAVDLVLTDPPYGIKRDKGFGGAGGFNGKKPIARRQYNDNWDKERPSEFCFKEILRIGKNILIFGGNYFADILPQNKHWVVWDKLNTMPTFGDCELIWTNAKRNSVKKITYQYNGLFGKEKRRYHPTQKPVGLIKKLLEIYSKEGDLIFDPFLGSGTTAVACLELNRHFIGIELSSEYCEIAKKRIREIQPQLVF